MNFQKYQIFLKRKNEFSISKVEKEFIFAETALGSNENWVLELRKETFFWFDEQIKNSATFPDKKRRSCEFF